MPFLEAKEGEGGGDLLLSLDASVESRSPFSPPLPFASFLGLRVAPGRTGRGGSGDQKKEAETKGLE